MELKQLGREYMRSARLCRDRAAQLRRELDSARHSQSDYITLRRRMTMLEEMGRQAAATGRYLLNYYGEEVLDLGQDTDAGISEPEELFEKTGRLGQAASPYAGRGNRAGAHAATGADGAHVLFGAALNAGDGQDTGRIPLDGQPHAGRGAREAQALPALRRKSPA